MLYLIPPSPLSGTLSSPPVTGTRPPPCSEFSFTMVDDHNAVLFGGRRQGYVLNNDVYTLDLDRMVSCEGLVHSYIPCISI